MYLRRSTFTRGLIAATGVFVGQVLLALGMPNSFHAPSFSLIQVLSELLFLSVMVNLSLFSAWLILTFAPRDRRACRD